MDNTLIASITKSLELLASAGGGGSGGGGGGGGSIIVFVGYVPMHALGALIRKSKKEKWLFDGLNVVGWIVAVLYFIMWVALFKIIGAAIGAAGLFGMAAGLYGLIGKLRQSKSVKRELKQAAAADPAWNQDTLLATTKQIFMNYQHDWSTYNTEAMKAYMTPNYWAHANLMIYALRMAGRRNAVDNPVIDQAAITDLTDAADTAHDAVNVGFVARAKDQIIDTQANEVLFINTTSFTEYWRFIRNGNGWLLDGIQPSTASSWTHNYSLEEFAAKNGYYFSLDWGWLLLPTRGQLFGKGKFGTADINNHVIGMYNNLLVQIYTYNPNPTTGTGNKSYLIAQTYVPKSYGEIVIRRRKKLHLFGIKHLKRMTLEWPDFNKKFEVYATTIEQVTSFELLNPSFMAKLYDQPFEINIQVVDNIIYFYANENDKAKQPSADRYNTILNLLHEAFAELRL